MTNYSNISGGSGIRAYELGQNHIIVQFRDFSVYEYTTRSVGSSNLAIMKQLAIQGSGLNSFINRNVKFDYSRRVK